MPDEKFPDGLTFRSDISVQLTDALGSDLEIVNAARVSTGTEHPKLTEQDRLLIRSLIRDEHGAPFEQVRFKFNIECPVFIARQWFKHRFSSFSEHSGRYSEYKPEFYIPHPDEVERQVGKRMSYTYEQHPDEGVREWFVNMSKRSAEAEWELYKAALAEGISKQQARINISFKMYTKFVWAIDLRNLTNFLVLRNDVHAQSQIMVAAKKVEESFSNVCPVTYDEWNAAGRPRLAGID